MSYHMMTIVQCDYCKITRTLGVVSERHPRKQEAWNDAKPRGWTKFKDTNRSVEQHMCPECLMNLPIGSYFHVSEGIEVTV